MQLAQVSFKNANGGNLEIAYKLAGQFAANNVTVAGNGTSAQLSGTLLSMDVFINQNRYTVDLTNYLPKGLWVEDESPYRVVAAADGGGHVLVIQDNAGEKVDEFKLTAV